jgi:exopolyphosphatase/pppGpp-phosphohydrolase
MQDRQFPVRAAIDIGSNTIHIVIARSVAAGLDILADEYELVRIGESVTASGEISEQKQHDALAVLRRYKELAETLGAEQVLVVATEAIRKANNSEEFLEGVQRETALHVELISGDVEATLTFYGATYEVMQRPSAPTKVAVMDLGGGSMELVMAKKDQITWQTSLPIGSGWLHDRYLPSEPPTSGEVESAQSFLRTFLADISKKNKLPMLIVTGGSATSLLMLAQKAFHLDEGKWRLSFDDILHCEGLLSALPAEQIAQRFGQPEGRTRILPAGALIIHAMMDRFSLRDIVISPHGIREGAILAFERFGENWLEQVRREASEHEVPTENYRDASERAREDACTEPFAVSGARMLHERVKKLLEWQDEVLKNEDSESVHKMRVATRRLRATLDAYESCCQSGKFKKVYRQVKQMADLLGTARDTDVMVQRLQEQHDAVPTEEQAGIQWLLKRLTSYREQRQQELRDYFETLDVDTFKRQVETCIPKGASKRGKS